MLEEQGIENQLDLLIIHTPCWGIKNPPFGSICIYNHIKRQGYQVKLVDLNIDTYEQSETKSKWDSNQCLFWYDKTNVKQIYDASKDIIDPILKEIKKTRPKIIGFSITGTNYLFANYLVEEIRRELPEQIIIAGGNGLYTEGDIQNLLDGKTDYDFLIIGEGEKTTELILENINSPEIIKEISNLILIKNSRYFKNTDLDQYETITIQNVELIRTNQNPKQTVDLNELIKLETPENLINLPYTDKISTPIFFSRGCIAKCTFCNDTKRWKHYRAKKAENVFAEIKYYYETYQITNFQFHDLVLNANLRELEKFCDLIIDSNLIISWYGYFRIHPKLTLTIARKLKKSGCRTINIGADNFSEKILGKMKKLYTQKDILKNLVILNRADLIFGINYITGYPGETEEDFKEEIAFLDKHHKLIPQFYALCNLHINEGTEIYETMEEENIILPKVPLPYNKWYLKDNSNNHEIRVERLNRFKEKCQFYNIPIDFINP